MSRVESSRVKSRIKGSEVEAPIMYTGTGIILTVAGRWNTHIHEVSAVEDLVYVTN